MYESTPVIFNIDILSTLELTDNFKENSEMHNTLKYILNFVSSFFLVSFGELL
jgi:hypothetical protein